MTKIAGFLVLVFIHLPSTTYAENVKAKNVEKAKSTKKKVKLEKANNGKLEDVDPRIKAAEDRVQCLNETASFQQEFNRRSSLCETHLTEFRACTARVRDRQSSNTGKGALLGIGAALLTGGGSLLFTGAGALIGHETSDEAPGECGKVPECDYEKLVLEILHDTGLRKRECP